MLTVCLHEVFAQLHKTNSCLDILRSVRANVTEYAHCMRWSSGGHANSVADVRMSTCGTMFGEEQSCMSMSLLLCSRTPGRLHVETWAGHGDGNPSLPISQVVEIMLGCADMVDSRLPPPLFSSVSPGPGREVRNGMGWSLMGEYSQVWGMVVPGCLVVETVQFLHLLHSLIGLRKDRSLQRGRVPPTFFVLLFIFVSGEARLSGHILESRVGHCQLDCGGLSLLLMKPWCAEGDVPTAANLNLYREGLRM